MFPCSPSSESDADRNDTIGMHYINGCVSRSNALVKNDSYYIQLVFLRCDGKKNREFAKSFFRILRTESKEDLKVTYIVGMDMTDTETDDVLFMQDGKYISFNKKEYDSVRRLFTDLPAQKNRSVQIVIFKVKGGLPVTEDACECRCIESSEKARYIAGSDKELSKKSASDNPCYDGLSSIYMEQRRPLGKDYDPNVRTLKRSESWIPGKGQIYLHQYKRGTALILLNIMMILVTVCYFILFVMDETMPTLPILIMFTGTFIAWFYSIDDVAHVYRRICDGEIEVDFEFLPPHREIRRSINLQIYLVMIGAILVMGTIRMVSIKLHPVEVLIGVSIGGIFLAAAVIAYLVIDRNSRRQSDC